MNSPKIAVQYIGHEQEPVAIIDNFSPDAEHLRQYAEHATFVPDDLYYPGIKAALPAGYFSAVQNVLATAMCDVFSFSSGADVLRASYAIVTTPPHLLSLEQRLPHVDALDPGRMAILHYLALDNNDGTAFYRHRATGYESVDEARGSAYFTALNEDLRKYGAPADAYICGDTPIFEQTGRVDGRFNRALIYRGHILHSGAISAGRELPSDPRTGRLTIASFLTAT